MRSLVTVFPAAALGRTAPGTFGRSVFRTFSTALREWVLLDILVEEFLYLVEGKHVILIDQGDCHTIAVSTCRTADAVHIVLGIVRHVVVDDHGNIIDINATGHDIRGHEHINLAALKLEHDIVALSLFKVRVHLTAVDLQLLQSLVDLLHFHLTSREDNNPLEVAGLEDVLNDLELLCLVADISTLLDLVSRFAHGKLHLNRVLQQVLRKFLNVLRHCGREHDRLTVLGETGGYLHDVLGEAHVEHAVSLIQHKEANFRQIDVPHRYM